MKVDRPKVIVEPNCANSTRISIGESTFNIEIIATENSTTGLEIVVHAKGKKVEVRQ